MKLAMIVEVESPRRSAATCDLVRRIAQFGEDGLGVLAERRHVVHARVEARRHAGRQQRRNRAGRRADLHPTPTRLQLRVRPHVGHRADVRVRDLRGLEPRDDLLAQSSRAKEASAMMRLQRGLAIGVVRRAFASKSRSSDCEVRLVQHGPWRRRPPTRARSAAPASRCGRRRPGTGRTGRSSRATRRRAAAARRRRTRSTSDSSSTRPCSRASTRRYGTRYRSFRAGSAPRGCSCTRTCRRRCRRSSSRPSPARRACR